MVDDRRTIVRTVTLDDERAVAIRLATPSDELSIRRILDGALLEFSSLSARIDDGDVLIAVDAQSIDRIVGVIVIDPRKAVIDPRTVSSTHRIETAHVDAIAVRNRVRNRGIGRALVDTVVARYGRISATFDADVRPFYESCSFAIEPMEDDRYLGVLDSPSHSCYRPRTE